MNIIEVFNSFQTQEQALQYLESIRWQGQPECPYCNSKKICCHVSGDRNYQRWQCQDCSRAFTVTVGTIFHRTHIPLRNWFLVIALMLNAKKSASACQIARDLGMRRPTVWSMMHRIRIAMAKDTKQNELLHGIVEADETYVGGKPRKFTKHNDKNGKGTGLKRGRGTKKTPVIGVVERYGRVVAEKAKGGKLNWNMLSAFIKKNVDCMSSILMTDEYRGYSQASKIISHSVINHGECYVDGMTHTNSIEGFWALLKRAWYGQHHHYSDKYISLYISEACYKYNNRRNEGSFKNTIGLMVGA